MEALHSRGVEVGSVGPEPIELPWAFRERLAVGAGPFESGRLAGRLARIAQGWGADLLHAHGLRAGTVVSATRLPYAYTLHGFPPSGAKGRLFAALEGPVVRRAHAVSAVSGALLMRADRLGASSPVLLAPAPDVPAKPLPWPSASGPTFGTLARLAPEKGLSILFEAMAELSETLPGARLVVGGEGPEEANLRRQAKDLGITSRVSFFGWVDPPDTFFEAIHLYVQPSLREGLGLAAQEALAAGRPVVVSRVGGLPEAVGQGRWARLVPPGDARALRDALVEASGDDLRSAGRAAHRHAKVAFRPEVFGATLVRFYGLM